MEVLFATLANDAEYLPALLHALGSQVAVSQEGASKEAWGLGYYADERALIIRKPAGLLGERSLYRLAPETRSTIMLAAAVGVQRQVLAPPFRFRNWLFGCSGDLSALETLKHQIIEGLPDFLREDLREANGAKLAGAMFLAELHRSSLLDDPLGDAEGYRKALGTAVDTINRLSPEAGGAEAQAAYVASNGRILLAESSGRPLLIKQQIGLEALPEGPPDPALNDFKQIAEALKRFRAWSVSLSAEGEGWTPLPDQVPIAIDAELNVFNQA